MNYLALTIATVFSLLFVASSVAREFDGVTAPSEIRELSFPDYGIIGQVHVKEGEPVGVDTKLMEQDKRQEQKLYDAMKVEAESVLPKKAAEKERDAAEIKHKKAEKMFSRGVLGEEERDDAELQFEISKIRVDLAIQEAMQKGIQLARQKIKVDQMTLTSPIKGIVRSIEKKKGENADPREPVITLVNTETLHVHVHIDAPLAEKLAKGQELRVRYANEESYNKNRKGEVIFIDPLAQPGLVKTVLVKLKLANTEKRLAGLKVFVEIPVDGEPSAKGAAADDEIAGGK